MHQLVEMDLESVCQNERESCLNGMGLEVYLDLSVMMLLLLGEFCPLLGRKYLLLKMYLKIQFSGISFVSFRLWMNFRIVPLRKLVNFIGSIVNEHIDVYLNNIVAILELLFVA